jgi:hypothetical protein
MDEMSHKERPAYLKAVIADSDTDLKNETRQLEHFKVERYRILGTRTMIYCVWEPSSPMGGHSTITTINGEWYGRVGTRRLPAWMESLKSMSDERARIVGEYHEAQYQQAYEIIRNAFPEVSILAHESMGELSTY